MAMAISNTSPLQYLHQLGLLDLLPRLFSTIVVPDAVARELAEGIALGVDLPRLDRFPWIGVRSPSSQRPDLGLLHAGEAAAIALALELGNHILILDDARARSWAIAKGLPITGTLGIVLDFKKIGAIPLVLPILDRLVGLRFRIDPKTCSSMLKLAGE